MFDFVKNIFCLEDTAISAKNSDAIARLFVITFFSLTFIFLMEIGIATVQLTQCSQEQIEQEKTSQKETSWLISCSDEKNKFDHDTYLSYFFQKIVYFTTEASIFLMLILFAYLSRRAYKHYQAEIANIVNSEELRGQEKLETEQKELGKTDPKKDALKQFTSTLLKSVLIGSLSVSAIPTGISLMICAFYDINFIKYMSGVEVYVIFAGISIISIGFVSALQEYGQIEPDITSSPEKVGTIMNNEKITENPNDMKNIYEK